jgi:hypothetical protein
MSKIVCNSGKPQTNVRVTNIKPTKDTSKVLLVLEQPIESKTIVNFTTKNGDIVNFIVNKTFIGRGVYNNMNLVCMNKNIVDKQISNKVQYSNSTNELPQDLDY